MSICQYCTYEADLTRITKLSSSTNGKDREVRICQRCINEMQRRGELYHDVDNHNIYLYTANADPHLHSRLIFSNDDTRDSQRKF